MPPTTKRSRHQAGCISNSPDGLNLLTLNALYRMPLEGTKFVPYVGAGAGVNIRHLEVTRGSGRTFEYQLGGATLQAQAGVAYEFTKN
jgi:lipid A oxidase